MSPSARCLVLTSSLLFLVGCGAPDPDADPAEAQTQAVASKSFALRTLLDRAKTSGAVNVFARCKSVPLSCDTEIDLPLEL